MNKEDQILNLKTILYSNFNKFDDDDINKSILKLAKLIEDSNKIIRDKFGGCLIDSYKFLSESIYLTKNYRECLIYLKKIECMKEYKTEVISTINHVEIRKYQCNIMVSIYENNKENIKRLKEDLKIFGKNNREKLQETLRNDYDRIFDLADSYLNESIKTIINFKLPYKIDIPESEEIEYTFNDTLVTLKFKTILENNRGLIPFEPYNGIIEIDKDKYGVSAHTDLTLTFNKFYDATHDMQGLIEISSEVFNYFLDYYRNVTNQYWIDNINLEQIHASNVRVISSKYDDIISIPLYYGKNIKVSKRPTYISVESIKILREKLQNKEKIELWEKLYHDAKNYMFIEKYREALISINSAFENYLNIKSREILNAKMNKDEIEDYLAGTLSYDTYMLKDFIKEDDFNKAIDQEILKPFAPSTFQIVKQCIEMDEKKRITKSKRQINKLINYIRKNRNDIIHGNLSNLKDFKSDVKKSIESFEEFIDCFK